jgi:2-amino-4-hydroxy-6-hydroxymethyldihydropteridine diphosphokinase
VAGLTSVAVALGSNLGDRRAHLTWAIDQLGRSLQDLRASALTETDPVGVTDPQPPYLNAVVIGRTRLFLDELLDLLMDLERQRGRRRPSPRAPRTLDLDLILYGSAIVESDEAVVPHPRFRERLFVLEPLVTLAPDWKDPVTGRTVQELLNDLNRPSGPT